MRPFRSREYSGLYLAVVFLTICDLPAATQSNLAFESTDCKLYGDICLGPTAESAAKEVCSKSYKKDCTNAAANNNKCTREYVKDAQGGDASRCVWDLIMELSKISSADRCGLRATEALVLRQEISEMVTTASLQVDGFLSEIDSETGQVRAVHDDLSDRRDAAVSLSTLGSAVGTGGGAVGSSLALARKTATVGNWVGAIAGGVGTVFGFLGWYQQPRGPKGCFPNVAGKHCQLPKPPDCNEKAGCSPVMLFRLVFPEPKPNDRDFQAYEDYFNRYIDYHSDYDLPIQNYLAGFEVGASKTRGGTLISQWLDEAKDERPKHVKKDAHLPSDTLASFPNYTLLNKEPFLFYGNGSPRKVSIDDLSKRADKLADLRSVVSRMNRNLSRLTETLAGELECPAAEVKGQ